MNENASLVKYEPPKCDECGRKIVVLSDLCAKCAAGIELNGKEQVNPLPTWPKPSAPPNPPPAPAGAQSGFSWATGEPPRWFKEWFIAKLDNGQRVVLKRLPEDFTYDYTTADETYYAKRRIAKWMQFPDSEFVSLNPSPAVAQSWEPDEKACKFLADMITADPDQITRVGFHLGYAKDDAGNLVHGFSVYEVEYPEEGVHTLVETNPTPAVAVNEQMLEALKLAKRMFASDGPGLGEIFGALDAAIEQAEKQIREQAK